jgi:type II secretory pathway pseudopilin PulG
MAKIIKKKLQKHQGFTLIEVLVITGLTAIIMLATVSLFMTFLVNQGKISQRQELKNAGNNALKQITQVLREAKEINPCEANLNNQISFVDLNNQTGAFSLNGGVISLNAGVPINLTPDHLEVTGFSANCYQGDPSQFIRVNFTLSNPNPSGLSESDSQDFSTSITLRN